MYKKIMVFFWSLLLVLGMTVPAAAAEDGFANEYERMQDLADLLGDGDEAQLTERLNEVSERQGMDIVIVTTDTLDGMEVQDYADDFYDYCNFGYGADRDGLLLLINMEERDWYISTCGYGIEVFTDAGIQYIGEQIVPYLAEGDYAEAFETFISECDSFITQAVTGEPYDVQNLPDEPMSLMWIGISILAGAVVAACVVGVMASGMKSVRMQNAAGDYVRSGSMKVTDRSDLFLYHTVHRTAKPKDNESGGSSTHHSSSGTSHGGGGGKF